MMPVELAQAEMVIGNVCPRRMRFYPASHVPAGRTTQYVWRLGQALRISGQRSRALSQVAAQLRACEASPVHPEILEHAGGQRGVEHSAWGEGEGGAL